MKNTSKKSAVKKQKSMRDGGNVTDPNLERYADELFKLQQKKDFAGFDDALLDKYWIDNPAFKDNIPEIVDIYSQKYPDASHAFVSYETATSRKTGFEKKEKDPKLKRGRDQYREEIFGPPVEPGIIGRLMGRENIAQSTGVITGPENAPKISKQPVQTPLTKAENKRYAEAIKSGMIDQSEFEGTDPNRQREILINAGIVRTPVRTKNLADGGPVNPMMNPEAALRKDLRKETAGKIISGTISGASAGASAGLVGAGVGAGVGFLTSATMALINRKANLEEVDRQVDEHKSGLASGYMQAKAGLGYREGGKIKGEGGPKDDKVKMDVPEGSFVVPAENAEKAMELGRQFLGWNDEEEAGKNIGETRINASSGEVIFTPEEVDELDFYGVDLSALAPNAEQGTNMQRGGDVYSRQWSKDRQARIEGQQSVDEVTGESDPVKKERQLGKYMPEVLGALQTLAGLYGLATSKKSPDPVVSDELRMLARETQKLTEQGLDPATRNYAIKSIEQSRRSGINELTARGGSASDITSGMVGMTKQAVEGHERLAIADEEIRRSNRQPYFEALKMLSTRKDEISREKRDIREKRDEMFANLLHAGISNVVGARQLKEHMDFLEKNKANVQITTNP